MALTLLRTFLVTSCLLALSQACKSNQVTLHTIFVGREYFIKFIVTFKNEGTVRQVKEYAEDNWTVNLLEGDIFIDNDDQFIDTNLVHALVTTDQDM